MTRKEKLLKAIELATEFGNCTYVKKSEPCCVIAQLFVLEGGTIEDMIDWDVYTVNRLFGLNDKIVTVLSKYPLSLLNTLQACWDSTPAYFSSDAEAARGKMLAAVEDYAANGATVL